jgi:hypothetical protein
VKRAPDRFYLPRYIGRRGWCGLRLDLGDIDWNEVKVLAAVSYNLVAPKELRAPPIPIANVLTARSLVRGTPAPIISVGLAASRNVDGDVLMPRGAGEHSAPVQPLRPATAPGATIIRRSAGLRGRR